MPCWPCQQGTGDVNKVHVLEEKEMWHWISPRKPDLLWQLPVPVMYFCSIFSHSFAYFSKDDARIGIARTELRQSVSEIIARILLDGLSR